jgi:hypothetical protein
MLLPAVLHTDFWMSFDTSDPYLTPLALESIVQLFASQLRNNLHTVHVHICSVQYISNRCLSALDAEKRRLLSRFHELSHDLSIFLPRLYPPKFVCKQLLEINSYGTTHALLLNGCTEKLAYIYR